MSPVLPVSMIPVAARAAKSGGFVLAVVIGLTLFALAQSKQQTPPTQPN